MAMADSQLDAEIENRVDLELDQLAWQAVFGYTQPQHAPRHRLRLEEGYRIAQERQVVCGGEAGGTRADDRHAVVRVAQLALAVDLAQHVEVDHAFDAEALGDEALERTDRDRLVEGSAPARRLAGRGADTTANRSEWIGASRDRVGLPEAAIGDERDVAPRLGSDRAGGVAGEVGLQPLAVDAAPIHDGALTS
jgi:hypothetical protein